MVPVVEVPGVLEEVTVVLVGLVVVVVVVGTYPS